jgi:signal transduction histidine kinase
MRVMQEQANLQAADDVRLERRELDLWPLVQSMLVDLQPLAGASGTRLVNQVPRDLVANADVMLLTQILQNLIANAVEYSPRGEVLIKARVLDASGTVECAVCDDGAGIPAERLDKIFDKLETDPNKKTGLGLGLAIVKQYVEAHGGTVTVESQLGQGAVFRFTLPLTPTPRATADC